MVYTSTPVCRDGSKGCGGWVIFLAGTRLMSLSALAFNPGLCSVEFQVLCAKICGFKLLLPELQRESFGKRMKF